jgi:hypothetical protein
MSATVTMEIGFVPSVGEIETALRQVFGANYLGLASGGGKLTIVTNEPLDYTQFQLARQIVETGAFGLVLASNKAQIVANEQDTATLICNSPIIAADTALAYNVTFTGTANGVDYADGDYASGTVAVEGGAATLTLAVDFAGAYRVTVRRTAPGALEFASRVITASEATE